MKTQTMTEQEKYLEEITIVKSQLKKSGYQISDNYAEKNLENGWVVSVILGKNLKQSSKVSAKNINIPYDGHLQYNELFKDTDIKCTPYYVRNQSAYKSPNHIANGWATLLELRIIEKLSK